MAKKSTKKSPREISCIKCNNIIIINKRKRIVVCPACTAIFSEPYECKISQPPTDKQIAFLHDLGYLCTPPDKNNASNIIDEIVSPIKEFYDKVIPWHDEIDGHLIKPITISLAHSPLFHAIYYEIPGQKTKVYEFIKTHPGLEQAKNALSDQKKQERDAEKYEKKLEREFDNYLNDDKPIKKKTNVGCFGIIALLFFILLIYGCIESIFTK